jgi:hypothetical protein
MNTLKTPQRPYNRRLVDRRQGHSNLLGNHDSARPSRAGSGLCFTGTGMMPPDPREHLTGLHRAATNDPDGGAGPR